MIKPQCPWCADYDNADEDIDPTLLCRMHEAEHDGLSVAELERRDREQRAEFDEWVMGR
jgi:hypothetical protein